MEEGDVERLDRQIVTLRALGQSEAAVAAHFNISVADVRRVIDEKAAVALSAQNRVRMIYLQGLAIEELEAIFMKQARAGDIQSGNLCHKLFERKATLFGLNAPLRIDPIQLAESVQGRLTTTEQLARLLDDIQGKGKPVIDGERADGS
jgi:uncharacterized protein (DUF433 family)